MYYPHDYAAWRDSNNVMAKKHSNFKHIQASIPLSPHPLSPSHSPSPPPSSSSPTHYYYYYSSSSTHHQHHHHHQQPPSPSPSPSSSSFSSSPPHWGYRMSYPIPSQQHYPPRSPHSPIPISPASAPVINNNSMAYLEDILNREHTICLQVRSLSTTIAKLTKDVLATGKACPSSFVNILKEQVAKMQHLLATLNAIEQNKRAFPPEFVKEVTIQWHQRVAKQRGNRKRKCNEPSFEEFKVETPTTQETKHKKIVIPQSQSSKMELPQTPSELMNISSIIN